MTWADISTLGASEVPPGLFRYVSSCLEFIILMQTSRPTIKSGHKSMVPESSFKSNLVWQPRPGLTEDSRTQGRNLSRAVEIKETPLMKGHIRRHIIIVIHNFTYCIALTHFTGNTLEHYLIFLEISL